MKKILDYNLIIVLFLTASVCFGEVVDYLVTDGMGPYKLSNTNPKDVVVSLAKEKIDPIDYNVNEEKATIFFVKPPAMGKVVKVSYNTTPESVAVVSPNLVVNSYTNSEGEFSLLDGLYKSKAYGGDLNLKFALGNSKGEISSQNTASSVDYSKNFGKLKLGATYTTTGDNLNNVNGYKQENDLLQILASYNENNITLDTKYINYENTGKTVTDNSFGYNFSPNFKVNFSYNTENTDNETLKENKNIFKYSLENKFNDFSAKFYSNLEEEKNTETNNKKYGLELENKTFSLSGINLTNFDGQKTSISNMTQGALNLGKHIALTGAWKETKENYDTTVSYETGLAYKLNSLLNLSASYKQNQFNDQDLYYEFKSNLIYNPNKYIAWTAAYLNREISKDNRFSHLKLTGNYKIDRFNLYALYIDRNSTIADYEDTQNYKLTWQILKFLEICSQYTDNPENEELYTDKTEYGYGLKFNFGDFGISGNIYENLNETYFKTNQKYDFGLSAKLFGGSLTGTVVFNNSFGNEDNLFRQYILGYTKNIGKHFSLSMSGEYDERNINHSGFNKENLKGNLSLGIKF